MMSIFKRETGERQVACPQCGTPMDKHWYRKDMFSYICRKTSCGYVL